MGTFQSAVGGERGAQVVMSASAKDSGRSGRPRI